MNDKTKQTLLCTSFWLAGIAVGYFWPRSHYEVRIKQESGQYVTTFCAVQWDGATACSSPQGWVPLLPDEKVK